MDSDSTGTEEQQSSFGIKKIVDCKIGKCGRQMYKVKWVATWEPAENLTSVQHLIDEFWSYVDNAKTHEKLEQQHRKRMRLEGQGTNNEVANVDENFNKMSHDNKSEVQRLIARTNETSVGRDMLVNNINTQLPSSHMNSQNMTNFSPSPSPQNMTQQQNPAMQMQNSPHNMGNFNSSHQKSNYPAFAGSQQNHSSDQKGKFSTSGNKRNAPPPVKVEADETKPSPSSLNDAKLAADASAKTINNSGLKYLENFENPYVKILLACKVCNKEQSLKYPATWKRHYLTHADKQDLPHKCSFCDKRFVTSTNLKNHMKTHLKANPSMAGGTGNGANTSMSGGVIKEEPWFGNNMQQQF